MNILLQDLRYAIHQLHRSPAFAAVAVLTLALGIGANIAIFSVVNRVLLHPLPYAHADRLVFVRLHDARSRFQIIASDKLASVWHTQARSLDGVEAVATHDLLASDDRGARLVHCASISPGLPVLLDVEPVLGRSFTQADAVPGAPSVALLSYGTWQREYGGAKDVLGRVIKLGDVLHTIVGVMPPRLNVIAGGAEPPAVWLPLSLEFVPSAVDSVSKRSNPVNVVAQLRPGVPLARVRTELDALAARAQEAGVLPFLRSGVTASLVHPSLTLGQPRVREALIVLLAAVGLVLLAACANVANLLLARGASRTREIALRAALGAGRWRLVRQLMTENVVLALAAGVAGAALGWALLHVLVRLYPGHLAALRAGTFDPLVLLAITFALSLATGVLFGLVPSMQLASSELAHALRHGGFGVVRGGSGARLRAALVAAEMAISVILLVGAGLLVRSVVYLQSADIGFDPHHLFSVQLSLPRSRYQNPISRERFAQQLLDRIHGMPGVAAATEAFVAPGHSISMPDLEIRGRTLSEADAHAVHHANFVQPDYFRTLGIRLLSGRSFTAAEMETGQAVIINRAMAQRFWRGEQAVGQQLRSPPGSTGPWWTVVGIVDDAISEGLTQDRHTPALYRPYRPNKLPIFVGKPPRIVLIVRAVSDPAPIIAAIRDATRALDPEVAIPELRLTETALAGTLAEPRFNMALLTGFAVLALVLAAVGLAAVVGYDVAERMHEIGIRMALGAEEGNVLGLVLRQGMRAAVIGVVVGVLGALAATRLLAGLLYGVAPRDPLSFVGAVILLLIVALAASWLAARRATRVDPIVALRAE